MKRIIFILLIFLPTIVMGRAIDPLCNQTEKLKLRNETYNFSYAIEKYKEKDQILYKVTILNMKDNTAINYLDKTYSNTNNIITNINPGSNIIFKLIAKPGSVCDGYDIGNKTLVIPNYNVYKDDPLCIGNEEYFLCKENTATKISKEEFTRQINNYIKTKKEKKEVEETKTTVIKEEKIIKKVWNFVLKNYNYILFSIITIGIIGIALLQIKKHNSNDLL